MGAILGYLQKHEINSHCEPGAFYLVNNYSAGYDLDGHVQPLGPNNFLYPPQTVPTIAAVLEKAGVSFGTGLPERAIRRMSPPRWKHCISHWMRRAGSNTTTSAIHWSAPPRS